MNIKKILKVKSGIRIAGSDEEIHIGGIDKPIVKDPLTGEPYLPGSSLKGSMRSALEIAKGKTKPCDCGSCSICKLFGSASNDKKEYTRIIVRDAFLTEKSRKMLYELLPSGVEIKTENSINRVTGIAKSPRTFDRIPRGVEFEVNIVLRIFDVDNKDELLSTLNLALRLVELNYIGSSGSRGYGQVFFVRKNEDEDIISWNEDDVFNVQEELKKVENAKNVIKE